jgi:hypothetical protein
VGLVDGPIAMNHPDLTRDTIREVPGKMSGTCAKTNSAACLHGTFVAGILCAKRRTAAPALCPNCTLLAYPIFAETASDNTEMQSAAPRTSRRQSRVHRGRSAHPEFKPCPHAIVRQRGTRAGASAGSCRQAGCDEASAPATEFSLIFNNKVVHDVGADILLKA